MLLKIDHREGKLKELFDASKDIQFVYENLEFGDFQLVLDGDIKCILERKSIDDLLASIKDGRYKNQKARVLATFAPSQIFYIIEGKRPVYSSQQTKDKIVHSSIINTCLRDKIGIFTTNNVEDTFALLCGIYKRFKEDPLKYTVPQKVEEETVVITSASSSTEQVWKAMLCQIPGISEKSAQVIVDKWPTFQSMYTELSGMDNSSKITVLDGLKHNQRRLGKRTVDGILKQFF